MGKSYLPFGVVCILHYNQYRENVNRKVKVSGDTLKKVLTNCAMWSTVNKISLEERYMNKLWQKGQKVKVSPGVYLDGREYVIDRRSGIGGSDVSNVLSLKPYGCARRLFYEKIGQQSDFPLPAENPNMRRGKLLEHVAADLYAEETGRRVWRPGRSFRSNQHPFMIANIDRFFSIAGGKKKVGGKTGLPLEIKCPSKAMFYKIKSEGMPDEYLLQHQHYLTVLQREWGSLSFFCAETTDTYNTDIAFDEPNSFELIRAEAAFWKMITEKKPPATLSPDDERCPRCSWRVTCHGDLGIYLQPEPDMVWQTDLSELTQEYIDLRSDIDEREEILKQLASTISQKMIASKIETNNARVYATSFQRRAWNNKLLYQEHPEISEQYSSAKEVRQLKIIEK